MVVSYGKKPRKSKTSEVFTLDGLDFFLYNTKSSTKGTTEIYYIDGNIYPLITVAYSNEKAKLWLRNSITRVKAKIALLDTSDIIDRDKFVKIDKTDKKEDKGLHYPTLEEFQAMHNKIIKEVTDA